MQTLGLVDYMTIFASLAGITGIYQYIIYLKKEYYKPVVHVGLLPITKFQSAKCSIDEIGERSGADEMRFKKMVFADKIKSGSNNYLEKKRKTNSRILYRDNSNVYDLHVIIYNSGKSTLRDYKLNITLSEHFDDEINQDTQIRILKLETETARIDGLYVDPELYEGKNHLDKIPSKEIQEAYNTLNLNANFVTLIGELGNGIYEMIYLKVFIPEEVNKFAVYFEVDKRAVVPKMETYGQLVQFLPIN
jgi:hypothetical protein